MAKSISASAKRTEIPGQLDSPSHSPMQFCSVGFSLTLHPLSSLHDVLDSFIFLISLHMSIFLLFYHNHSVRGLEIVSICSSYSPDVANEVLLGNQRSTSSYGTNYNPGCLVRVLLAISISLIDLDQQQGVAQWN